jgi:hypothetical protein
MIHIHKKEITCCEISMDDSFLGEIFHSRAYLIRPRQKGFGIYFANEWTVNAMVGKCRVEMVIVFEVRLQVTQRTAFNEDVQFT